ncbi:MAG TPA: 30S ribosomal protein S1, partial [Verrucomicrobiae bacterium]|nr:30S ribosomal protein S1 [Verrucomicrobiae bacterium]
MFDDRDETEETTEEESFAELFEKSFKKTERLQPGQKVEAVVLKITSDWVFIDTGMKGEGVVDRKELLNADGELTVKEGEKITAYFLASKANEMRFTTKIGGAGANAQLEEAFRSGIPVEGSVEKEIKGGFEVRIAGSRAFCPFSQIDIRRSDNPAAHVGKRYPFRITEYAERGRNVVVSRRLLLEEEERVRKEALRETLQPGATVKGTVTSIRDFGAFVDIGGVQALVPVSEIAWGRVNVREVLQEGQEVEAVVKQVDWERDRISLSIRDTQANPWDRIAELFPEGSFHTGTVARLTQFGAFVTVAEGIDGLIHISKLGGGKRINHP